MPPENESVLDVVNAALAGDTSANVPADTSDEVDGDTDADLGEAVGGEADADPAAEGGEADGEGEATAGEGEDTGTGERNPDGTFKKRAKAAEPELDAEGKPVVKDGKPKDEAGKKQPDPLNDPIPEGLKKETSERIRSVIKIAKEVTTERDQIRTDFDYVVKGIQATGTTPEQYGETLSWLALFNSGDPQQQAKALELVEGMADRLATKLGKERTVTDPLAAHPDLMAAIKAGQINATYAKEVARVRNAGAFNAQLTDQVSAQQRQQQEFESAQQNARNELTALEQTLSSTDPDYAAKRAILVPVLQPIFRSIHPKDWKAKFEEAYKAVKVQKPVAPVMKVPKNQPMRPGKNNGPGTKTAPTSMGDAISRALDGMPK
jgi:hypothetical protein